MKDWKKVKLGLVECTQCLEKGFFSKPSPATISKAQYPLTLPIYYILKENAAAVDVQERLGKLEIEFHNTAIPDELLYQLDVVDFATPVSLVSATQEGESSVLNVSAGGDFDYLAYQTDNEYVLSIKPLTEQEKQEKKKDFEYNEKYNHVFCCFLFVLS